MDVYETRRERVRELIRKEHAGRQASFADRIGQQPSYVSRIVSAPGRPGHKNIGEEVARIIERRHAKPAGWLDRTEAQAAAQVREPTMLYGIRITEEGVRLGAEWEKLDPPVRQQMQTLIEMLVAAKIREAANKEARPKDERDDLHPLR